MGRKPNAIVQEFFHRGQKLTDASNRYVHTCKRCGVVFPKGRVDSLMSHLLRRCPSVTQEDRHLIYDAIQQQNPDLRRFHDRADTKSQQQQQQQQLQHHQLPHQQQQQQQQQEAFELQQPDESFPLLLQRDQSALDTLAEVSRRHLDYSSRRHVHDQGREPSLSDAGRELAERALLAQLQGNSAVPFLPSATPGSAGSHRSADAELGDPAQTSHYLESAVTDTIPSSPLIQAASEANRQLEQQAARANTHNTLDPQLEAPVEAHPGAASNETETAGISWHPTDASSLAPFADHLAQMYPTTSASDLQPLNRASKHKRRGQFSDTRRKEVQEIRKRGACIRCRMLKKPCSEGTPCSTCKNVESARLWKSSCLRTRLADEFTLWSCGLYHSKAKVDVPASVHGLEQCALPGRIEVRIFSQSTLCMTFAVRKYSKGSVSPQMVEPELMLDSSQHGVDPSQWDHDDILLLDEGEGMSSKIEEYANEMVDACTAAEPSHILRSTLDRARALIQLEELEAADPAQVNPTRSCYNLQSQQLLKNVIELWVETLVLADRRHKTLELNYNPREQPRQTPDLMRPADNDATLVERIVPSARSESLIFAQLLAATESRCFALSKSVMNEIERRLLQRQQVSRFSTFISAVILLNCIERMTGIYRAFDTTPSSYVPEPRSNEIEATSLLSPESSDPYPHPTDWPLPESPRKLWSQGEHFADLLIMLLRMRALPPSTTANAAGALVVNSEQSLPPGTTNHRPANRLHIDEEPTLMPASWLDPLQLNVAELTAKRDGAFPDANQDVADWNLKFIAKVLLPEGWK